MKTTHDGRWALSPLLWAGGLLAFGACKDDSPCDEGQVARIGSCYPVSVGGSAGAPAEPVDAGDGGSDPQAAAIGQPCTDTIDSSDCGEGAPICAPLPAGPACTQILCLEGEPNEGVCPSDWPCMAVGGNPSACLKF